MVKNKVRAHALACPGGALAQICEAQNCIACRAALADAFPSVRMPLQTCCVPHTAVHPLTAAQGKGGKNRRRGKNDSEAKRELVFKEDGQGTARSLHQLCMGRSARMGRRAHLPPQSTPR